MLFYHSILGDLADGVVAATVGGACYLVARRRMGRRKRLTASAIGDPAKRRQAIEQLSEEQVILRLGRTRYRGVGENALEYRPTREEKELHLCLAELLLAEDRAAEAASELERVKGALTDEEQDDRARLTAHAEIQRALERGDAQAALARLDEQPKDGPRFALLRARALAALDQSSDEVWRLLSEQPKPLLAEYANRHPDEPAAAVARRILDGAGAYR